MSVPKALKPAIDEALSRILDDPNGEFGPLRRKAFVAAWLALDVPHTIMAYEFLNVLAAERVLPIYEGYEHTGWTNNWYHKEFARRMIQIAKATIIGEIPRDVTANLATSYHMILGNLDAIDCNADAALHAAYSALPTYSEKFTPLWKFEQISRLAIVGTYNINPSTGQAEKTHDSKSLQGEQFTDMDWVRVSKSDAAAAAAIAWSCTPGSYQPQVDKLKSFWEWWFNTAIPEAWEMVGHQD